MTQNVTDLEELNRRSRWYSSQLWYVPFAYLGIVGLGVEKVSCLDHPLKNIAHAMLALFSLAVFVHICSLKYYERRVVKRMQDLEDPVVSGGGSPWYMSFTFYLKVMLAGGSYGFAWFIWNETEFGNSVKWVLIAASYIVLSLPFVAVIVGDFKRNSPVVAEIRKKRSAANTPSVSPEKLR